MKGKHDRNEVKSYITIQKSNPPNNKVFKKVNDNLTRPPKTIKQTKSKKKNPAAHLNAVQGAHRPDSCDHMGALFTKSNP